MIFKIICLNLISYLYLQNSIISLNPILYERSKYVCVESFNKSQHKLIASLANRNIKLFALSSQQSETYDTFLLSVNNKTKVFKWSSETSVVFSPEIILSDINNDKDEELIIILTTGSGSDIHM